MGQGALQDGFHSTDPIQADPLLRSRGLYNEPPAVLRLVSQVVLLPAGLDAAHAAYPSPSHLRSTSKRKRRTHLVHALADVCPWCPEVEDGHAGEILRKEVLEVLRRVDGDEAEQEAFTDEDNSQSDSADQGHDLDQAGYAL